VTADVMVVLDQADRPPTLHDISAGPGDHHPHAG
jgi:hypothetical protein